jgi:hypothetical protein
MGVNIKTTSGPVIDGPAIGGAAHQSRRRIFVHRRDSPQDISSKKCLPGDEDYQIDIMIGQDLRHAD